MREVKRKYKKLVLVCTNERTDGRECCAHKGSPELYEKLKTTIKATGLAVRVSRTGCLGNCETGVTVVLMPDDLWLGDVREEDIPEIVRVATHRSAHA